jgi:hypothetical protein
MEFQKEIRGESKLDAQILTCRKRTNLRTTSDNKIFTRKGKEDRKNRKQQI